MGRAVARCGRSALGVGLLLLLLPPPVAGDQLMKDEYKGVVAKLEKADQGQPIKVGQSFFYLLSPAHKAAWAGDTETWYFVGGTLEAPKVVRDQIIPQLSGAPSTLKLNSLLMLQRKEWSLIWSTEADVVKAGGNSKGYGNLIDPRTLKLVPIDFYRTVYFETFSGKLELTAEPESCEEVYQKDKPGRWSTARQATHPVWVVMRGERLPLCAGAWCSRARSEDHACAGIGVEGTTWLVGPGASECEKCLSVRTWSAHTRHPHCVRVL
jgi:hypothetical protein